MFYEPTNQDTIELTPASRKPEEQNSVDEQTAKMILYHYESCFFSARVKRAIEILKLKIKLKDILETPEYGKELLEGGGSSMVPCLYFEDHPNSKGKFMYESSDIVEYLGRKFS